jgi:hypothetical protein
MVVTLRQFNRKRARMECDTFTLADLIDLIDASFGPNLHPSYILNITIEVEVT